MDDRPNPTPYDSPELYDLLFDSLDFDVAYWLGAAARPAARCSKRPAARAGFFCPSSRPGIDIEGFDASPAMVRRLKERAAAAGLAVRAEVADMRAFAMGRRYALIFCGFNGFAHCETIQDQVAFLRAALEHLAPGGALAIHMSYPGPAYWSEPEGKPSWSTRRRGPAAASSSCGTTAGRISSPSARIPRWRSGSSTLRSGRRPSTSSRRPSAGSIASSSSSSSGGRLRPVGDPRRIRRPAARGPRRPDDRPGLPGLTAGPRNALDISGVAFYPCFIRRSR